MLERVRITDVSPRDGLQNERAVMYARDKARLIELLSASGVDEIEATSFVSPKWVPQLGDAEQVLSSLHASGWSAAPRPALAVLVPNEKGFERALAFHSGGLPLKVAVFTAASETFSKKNTNASIAETIDRFRAFLPRAFDAGMRVRMYISCAVACPFEGPVAPAAVRRVAEELLSLVPASALGEWNDHGPRVELDLGDTIGEGTPESVHALLECFSPDLRRRLVLHFHDTFHRAADCVRTALKCGVRSFDGSVAGLGGCPYAGTPDRPAPGNIATETLVQAVRDAGLSTSVDPARLREAAAFAREALARARAAPAP